MAWNLIFEIIEPKLVIVVAMCWCVGFILKQTPIVPNWTIVYLVTLTAVGLVIWMNGFVPESIIQGVLCGAFSVYGHQIFKQTREGTVRKR